MSCHSCVSAFGFLNREKGCPKCGFAFCKKCLRYKLPAGTLVCKSCHDRASMEKTKSLDDDSPLGFRETRSDGTFRETVQVVKAIRRLESLENPSKPPIIVYAETATPRIDLLRKGLSDEDQKLVDRLANLRNSEKSKRRKSEDPAEDVAARLAHLRGEEPGQASATRNIDPLLISKKANETEDQLLVRLSQEASLDKQYNDNLISDIEERLGKLREPTRKIPSASSSSAPTGQGQVKVDSDMDVDQKIADHDDFDEETEVQRIINKFVAEVALEADTTDDLTGENSPPVAHTLSEEEDDLSDEQMCRICDARATLRCKECDGDIFCQKCFTEFHHELGEKHKSSAF